MQRSLPLSILLSIASAALAVSGAPTPISPYRYVLAHWLVPMAYKGGQLNPERNRDDVRAALEEGVDGFALDAFSGSAATNYLHSYITAADELGAKKFKVFLSADMSLGFKASEIVDTLTTYGSNPHYLKMNGKPVLSTYSGEKLGNAWWLDNVIGPLAAAGHSITFLPFFDRPNPNSDDPSYKNWAELLRLFPVADGLFNFGITASMPFYVLDPNLGHHKWSALEGEENLARAVHDAGKLFITPYMPYYWAVCHPARQYDEFQAGRGMENMWNSIVTRQKPEAVEIVTWNDYTESTYIEPTRIPQSRTKGIPSYSHLAYYELLKYYINWYHTGERPTVSRDAVFYFYRPNLRPANPPTADNFCPLGPITTSQLWGHLQNVIYITTALTSPAELRVSSGALVRSSRVPTGLVTTDVPLRTGHQLIELWRNGRLLTRSEGVDVSENFLGDNFNVYSGYSVSGGSNSETWSPSDLWRSGFISDWFAYSP